MRARRWPNCITGTPHLGSGITWAWQENRDGNAHLNEGLVSIIDTGNWQLIKSIPTLGPGFFMRSHEKILLRQPIR